MLPAGSEVGVAEFVVIRSASVAVATTSAATAVLFVPLGSVVEELTMTVSLIAVPAAVPAVHLHDQREAGGSGGKAGVGTGDGPVPPTAGVMQDQPTGNTDRLKRGIGRRNLGETAAVAVLGPALVITCV